MTRRCETCCHYSDKGTCDASEHEPMRPDDLCDDWEGLEGCYYDAIGELYSDEW